jgi:hypothetical protein
MTTPKTVSPQVIVAMTVIISNVLSIIASKVDCLPGTHTETVAGAIVVLILAGLGFKTTDTAQKQQPPEAKK